MFSTIERGLPKPIEEKSRPNTVIVGVLLSAVSLMVSGILIPYSLGIALIVLLLAVFASRGHRKVWIATVVVSFLVAVTYLRALTSGGATMGYTASMVTPSVAVGLLLTAVLYVLSGFFLLLGPSREMYRPATRFLGPE
ncbi:hypothetical protein WCD74_01305 [Actinomycetospora sp. OC33-EN08]|uniref:Uncharacterized protein n=1 Tax=Actinomycetospora aurantiaca TaxID=3129233 RepID=A0ABU8MGN0_9PSEU